MFARTPEANAGHLGNSKPLIFVHIHKTGGVTLREVLCRHFPSRSIYTIDPHNHTVDDFYALQQAEVDAIMFLNGHFNYGLHQRFSRPCTYYTMLREPVNRVLSLYYYLRKRNPLFGDINLETFCQQKYHFNQQIKHIAGIDPKKIIGKEDLELAKDRLLNDYLCYGLTEEFDLSLLLLQKRLKLEHVNYVKLNATNARPKLNEISDEIIKTIRRNNSYDIELYEYAKERFYDQADCREILRGNHLNLFRFRNCFTTLSHKARRAATWPFKIIANRIFPPRN
ncbi:MAG: sulfotransferase family 2 domain-containing protein [Candidatus Margulisiibacteriota bacterium]